MANGAPVDLSTPAAQQERQLLGIAEDQQLGVIPGDNVRLANLIYGEVGSQNDKVMTMVGSTVLNRLESGRLEEFGSSVENVINSEGSPYFASLDNSDQYKQATTGKFPDKTSENAYKKALQIANGLIRGTIPRHAGMFFFEGKEISAMKRRKKKSFDFKKVNDTGKVGKYHTFSY